MIQEALDFLERHDSSTELSERDRDEGLDLTGAWIQDVHSLLEEHGSDVSALRETGEHLLRGLGELQRELQEGEIKRGRDLEEAFQAMLERLS